MNRKHFIQNSIIAIPGVYSLGRVLGRSQEKQKFDTQLVEEFVGKAHRDLDHVKAMLKEYPTLINVAHDWGNGDFETALGAASHVGYVDLVKFLLKEGAQFNIFTAAVLGEIEIVKSIITLSPEALNAKGPHGFTLLHHAIRGGEPAKETAAYLKSLGATDTKLDLF